MTPDGQAFTALPGASKQGNIWHIHSYKITLSVCLTLIIKFDSIMKLTSEIEKMARVIQLHSFYNIMILLQGTQGSHMVPKNATQPDGPALTAPNSGASKQGNAAHHQV